MISAEEQKAFARQSLSDLSVYNKLCLTQLPTCHRLHYLQMHFEKLAKAFTGDLPRSHNVIVKTIPLVVRENWRAAGCDSKPLGERMKRIREICREIELLCPAVDDDGRRPDNVEYPWKSPKGRKIHIPCEHHFEVEKRLQNSDGRLILKITSFKTQELSR